MDTWMFVFAAYTLFGFYDLKNASRLKTVKPTTSFENSDKLKSGKFHNISQKLPSQNNNIINETLINTREAKTVTKNGEKQPFLSVKDSLKTIEERLVSVADIIVKRPQILRFHPKFSHNGTFTDLNMSEYEDLRRHARRLGSIVHHESTKNGSISSMAEASFEFLTYHVPKPKSKNWWVHLIGIPTVMWPTIFVARSYLNEKLKLDFLDRYFSNSEMGPVWNPDEMSGRMAGGNLGPRMMLGLVENFLAGTLVKYHEEVKKALYKEVILRVAWNGNGMRQDGCLHQHNQIIRRNPRARNFTKVLLSQVYNNNYGKEFLKNAAMVMWLFDGTCFDLGNDIEEGIFASFFECQQWLYRYTTVEPSTVGKFIDSGNIITRVGGLDAVARTLKLFLKIDRHREEVISALHRYYHVRPGKKFALEGNRHFFVSDLMAHQRINYMASLRLLSRRTSRPETIPSRTTANGGTSKGYFLGDGFLTVLVTGKEVGSPNKEIFQAYDWARIPGTTCQYTTHVPEVSTYTPSKKHSYNDAAFVGGVTNRKEGVAAMEYARPTLALRAKKSWFFFDDVIICLGSGVSLPAKNVNRNPVITTLNQVIYAGNHTVGDNVNQNKYFLKTRFLGKRWTTYEMNDGKWFHHDSVGYVPLLHSGKIVLELDKRIIRRKPKDAFIYTFSLWLDHGRKPSNSVYAYAILPGKTAQETKNFARNPTTKILSLDNFIHAACFDPLKVLGIVFFTKGCINTTCLTGHSITICSDEPILIILKALFIPHVKEEEHCPHGKKSLNGNLEKYGAAELKRNSFTEEVQNDIRKNNLPKQRLYHHNNELFTINSFVLQISAADPTQNISVFNLRLQITNKTYEIPINLPESPKKGDSIIICLENFL